MQSIIGTWKGFYEYGNGYQLPYFAGRVEFELTLNGSNEDFTGLCTDFESDLSDHMSSEISGFTEVNFISFRKIYEHLFTIEDDGTTTKELNKEAVVFYTGEYDAKFNCLYGFWEYSAEGNGLVDDELYANFGGIWKCTRANLT